MCADRWAQLCSWVRRRDGRLQKLHQGFLGDFADVGADGAVRVVVLPALERAGVARCAARQQELLDQRDVGVGAAGQHICRDPAEVCAVLIATNAGNEVRQVVFGKAGVCAADAALGAFRESRDRGEYGMVLRGGDYGSFVRTHRGNLSGTHLGLLGVSRAV